MSHSKEPEPPIAKRLHFFPESSSKIRPEALGTTKFSNKDQILVGRNVVPFMNRVSKYCVDLFHKYVTQGCFFYVMMEFRFIIFLLCGDIIMLRNTHISLYQLMHERSKKCNEILGTKHLCSFKWLNTLGYY